MATQNVWKRIDRYPPILVRLLARHPRSLPLTDAEIAQRSGGLLGPYQVGAISQALSWDRIAVGDMRAFLLACGFDICNRRDVKRVEVYLKTRASFRYLRRSPLWETQFKHLVNRFREQHAS
jgi:hypothetical protein